METTTQTITFDEFAERLQQAEVMLIGETTYNIGYVEADVLPDKDGVQKLTIVFVEAPYAGDYVLTRSDNESVEVQSGGYWITFEEGCNGDPEETVIELFKLTRI